MWIPVEPEDWENFQFGEIDELKEIKLDKNVIVLKQYTRILLSGSKSYFNKRLPEYCVLNGEYRINSE